MTEEVIVENTNTVVEFMNEIERIRRSGNVEYIDAIVHYCDRNGIEIETVAKIIHKNALLKSRIQDEAETLNYIPKTAKLPI